MNFKQLGPILLPDCFGKVLLRAVYYIYFP